MIFCKISKFHDISMTGKAFVIFPGFPGPVGTLPFVPPAGEFSTLQYSSLLYIFCNLVCCIDLRINVNTGKLLLNYRPVGRMPP